MGARDQAVRLGLDALSYALTLCPRRTRRGTAHDLARVLSGVPRDVMA
jgi:hypothetical protein